MNYIRAPELSSPMSTINRDSKCTFIPDLYLKGEKIGRCNKSISTFHGVTIKPHQKLNGIHDAEIEKITEQVQKDYNSGWVIAATFGIEGKGIHRHVHTRMILESSVQSCKTRKRFEPLIAETRQIYVDEAKKENVTVKVKQPPQREMPNWRAFTHLAYPWKCMAKGHVTLEGFKQHFVEWIPKDSTEYRSFGLFPMEEEDKKHFATAIWNHWQKEKAKVTYNEIRMDETIHALAKTFLEENGFKASLWQPNPEAQATIIVRMVLHKGDKQYRLANNFFKIKGIPALLPKKLVMMMESPKYKMLLYSGVLKVTSAVLDVPLVVTIPMKAMVEKVKELEKWCNNKQKEYDEMATEYREYRQRGRKRKFEATQRECKACKEAGEGRKCNEHDAKLFDSDDDEHNYELYRNYCDSDSELE
jgi:hypothetical protein